ncbi:MAG: bacillithiol biosynthesis BshC [Bacteroidetes bacterium]|nr:bacillithiol biosynthesis BshC [Bacteroidota bacterium]
MASEDHDLEEIASISFFGNQVKWDTNQSGAVGRMNTKGVAELFQDLIDKYQLSDIQQHFFQRAVQIYRQSENLAIAFRKLLHDYLGHTGLIILDADSKLLKSSFSSVMIDELNYSNNQAIIETSQKLEKAGFKRQLRVRSCNLFLLQKNDRVRIDDLADFSGESPVDFVKENYNNLSPNAALRPLYQEWILPNVCAVLGLSELNYWLQLKGLFDNYEMPLPSMIVRTSAVLIPFKFQEKYFNNDLTDWFEDENAIALKHDQELAAEKESHDKKLEIIKSSIKAYDKAILETFKEINLVNKWSKLIDKLIDIEHIMENKWSQRIANSADLKKVLKMKRAYFNSQQIQERTEHIGTHSKLLFINSVAIQQNFGIESNHKVWIIFY